MKVIYSGFESSGKSLLLAITCKKLVRRNSGWYKITGVERPIYSNMAFSEEFVQYAESMNVPIKYWDNVEQLVQTEEADIICDEVGNYFDARGWQYLSLSARKWLSQGAKTGIEFYGGAQDFTQIDFAFRRLVQNGDLKLIRKVIGSERPAKSKPPIKRIWGLCVVYNLDAKGYSESNPTYSGGIIPSRVFLIRKEHTEIFNTNQKIAIGEYPPLRHITRFCERHKDKGGDGSCTYCVVNHS